MWKNYDTARPTGDVDTVVIGSGMSGLATAALYAGRNPGKAVIVLEQHDTAGGCMHSFK